MSRIYVASSWRNAHQPNVVAILRELGHEVYDVRNPAPGNTGFAWSDIDPAWQAWDSVAFRGALDHPIAAKGYMSDMTALVLCDWCLCVLPCGRSAHLELGWACGDGKRTAVLLLEPQEPELMYGMVGSVLVGLDELKAWAS